MAEIIELTHEEMAKVGAVQYAVTAKYMGKPTDLAVLGELRRELVDRLFDAGFVSEVTMKSDGSGNIIPQCTIVGRVEPVEFDPDKYRWEHKGE